MSKISTERTQKALMELVSQSGNDVCADCKSRNPRWASHNLGIFICVNCASIHRKIGSHVTKVKSLTMDTWTKDQVEHMKRNGNAKSNLFYCPNEIKYPPPTNMIDSERDSELEKYIRAKYESKRFVDKSAFVAAQLGPSRSAASVAAERQQRPQSTPLVQPPQKERDTPTKSPTFPSQISSVARPIRSVSQPLQQLSPPTSVPSASVHSSQCTNTPSTAPRSSQPQNPLWADLVSLQQPSTQASLPLQYQPSQTFAVPTNSLNPNQLGGQSFQATYTTGPPALGAPNPFLQMQQQIPGQYALSQQMFTPANPSSSANAMLQTPHFIQPQATSFGQQYFSQAPMQTPSPQSFVQPNLAPQNNFLSPSPNPQMLSGADIMRSTPSPFMQVSPSPSQYMQTPQPQSQFVQTSPSPFGMQPSFQQHTQIAPQQQDQFTSWLSKGPGGGFGQG